MHPMARSIGKREHCVVGWQWQFDVQHLDENLLSTSYNMGAGKIGRSLGARGETALLIALMFVFLKMYHGTWIISRPRNIIM